MNEMWGAKVGLDRSWTSEWIVETAFTVTVGD